MDTDLKCPNGCGGPYVVRDGDYECAECGAGMIRADQGSLTDEFQ